MKASNIVLTADGSQKLAQLVFDKAVSIHPPQGDGFAYRFKQAFMSGKLNGMLPWCKVLKVMGQLNKESMFLSFGTWFSGSGLNLCQTRVYYDGNLRCHIGMGDGWDEEVYKNVLFLLASQGIGFETE